jgi:hypothetical protein
MPTDVRRITDADEIIRIVSAHHPHMAGANWLKRFVERDRIAHAIHAEQSRLSFCLVHLGDPGDPNICGAVAAIPMPQGEAGFSSYGAAPMFFGFLFGFKSFADFQRVFDEISRLAVERDRKTIFGPFEATINYSCGLLEDTPIYPLGLLMPENPIVWNGYFEQLGYAVAERLFTFEVALDQLRRRRRLDTMSSNQAVTTETLKLPLSPEQRAVVADVFNDAWRDNWGFVAMDAEFIQALEKEFAPLLWAGAVTVAYQGPKPVGILIGTPDLNEVLSVDTSKGPWPLISALFRFFVRRRVRAVRIFFMGVVPEVQGTREGAGIVELLLTRGKDAAMRHGATHLQLGWTLSRNHRVNSLIRLWAPQARQVVHRIWQCEVPAAWAPGHTPRAGASTP